MPYSPTLLVHIAGGTLGLLSGTAAICFRKGCRPHVLAGRVFVASMLIMAMGAVYLGIVKHQPNNVSGGIFTFYLIGTAWLTARRRPGEKSRLDWVALLIPLALGILTWLAGISVLRKGESSQEGVPVGIFGSPFIAIDGIGAGDLGVGQVVGRGKPGSDLQAVRVVAAEIDADVDNQRLQLRIGKDLVEGGLQRCQSVRKPPLLGIAGEGEDTQISRGLIDVGVLNLVVAPLA